MAINYIKDTNFADVIFSKMTKRLPIKAMTAIGRANVQKYLFESADKCFCSACERSFTLKKLDKHKTERSCPKCHKAVIVQRNCGASQIQEHSNVLYTDIVGNYVVNRYFRYELNITNKKNGNVRLISEFTEVGRQIVGESVSIRFEKYHCGQDYGSYCNRPLTSEGWYRLTDSQYSGYYFSVSRDIFHCSRNIDYIGTCYPYIPQIKKAFDKFINPNSFYFLNKRIEELSRKPYSYAKPFDISYKTLDEYGDLFVSCMYEHSDSYWEKFYKLGLEEIGSDYRYSDSMRKIVKAHPEVSICDVLGVNKAELSFIRSKDDVLYAYNIVRANDRNFNYPIEKLELIYKVQGLYEMDMFEKKANKTVNYLLKQNITISEYKHYKEQLNRYGFPLDNSNLYPKDFRKAEDELVDISIASEARAKSDRSPMITKISKALREMPDIKDYIGGSTGLLVKVPETAEELIKEGKKLHNCLATYVDRVARGETSIFFIRRIDEPDKPFYAMEYSNGQVRQLYTYNNKKGNDYDTVYTFCADFINILNKLNYQPKEVLKVA